MPLHRSVREREVPLAKACSCVPGLSLTRSYAVRLSPADQRSPGSLSQLRQSFWPQPRLSLQRYRLFPIVVSKLSFNLELCSCVPIFKFNQCVHVYTGHVVPAFDYPLAQVYNGISFNHTAIQQSWEGMLHASGENLASNPGNMYGSRCAKLSKNIDNRWIDYLLSLSILFLPGLVSSFFWNTKHGIPVFVREPESQHFFAQRLAWSSFKSDVVPELSGNLARVLAWGMFDLPAGIFVFILLLRPSSSYGSGMPHSWVGKSTCFCNFELHKIYQYSPAGKLASLDSSWKSNKLEQRHISCVGDGGINPMPFKSAWPDTAWAQPNFAKGAVVFPSTKMKELNIYKHMTLKNISWHIVRTV